MNSFRFSSRSVQRFPSMKKRDESRKRRFFVEMSMSFILENLQSPGKISFHSLVQAWNAHVKDVGSGSCGEAGQQRLRESDSFCSSWRSSLILRPFERIIRILGTCLEQNACGQLAEHRCSWNAAVPSGLPKHTHFPGFPVPCPSLGLAGAVPAGCQCPSVPAVVWAAPLAHQGMI